MSGQIFGPLGVLPIAGGGGGSVVALDGHNIVNTTATSVAISLTTANAGDVIIICGFANVGTGSGGVTVTDNFNGGAGLSWTSRTQQNDAVNNCWFFTLWAVAAAAITSGSATVSFSTLTGYSAFSSLDIFGVSGAHTAAPFDGSAVYSPVGSGPASRTTATANDFVFGIAGITGTTGALGGGWSTIDTSSANFFIAEQQVAVGTGTFTVNVGGGAIFNGSLIDAIIPGP